MSLSAILVRCSSGATNSCLAPYALISALYFYDVSLSNMCFSVPNPAVFIHIIMSSYVFNIWGSVMLPIDLEKM